MRREGSNLLAFCLMQLNCVKLRDLSPSAILIPGESSEEGFTSGRIVEHSKRVGENLPSVHFGSREVPRNLSILSLGECGAYSKVTLP